MNYKMRFVAPLFGLLLGLSASGCDEEEPADPTCRDWLTCYDGCIQIPSSPFDIDDTSIQGSATTCAQQCQDETGYEELLSLNYCTLYWDNEDLGGFPVASVAAGDITHSYRLRKAKELCEEYGTDSDVCSTARQDANYSSMTMMWCRSQCAQNPYEQ